MSQTTWLIDDGGHEPCLCAIGKKKMGLTRAVGCLTRTCWLPHVSAKKGRNVGRLDLRGPRHQVIYRTIRQSRRLSTKLCCLTKGSISGCKVMSDRHGADPIGTLTDGGYPVTQYDNEVKRGQTTAALAT